MARAHVREWLGEHLDLSRVRDVELVATEFVTNAVLHANGAIALRVVYERDKLQLEIVDEGGGFERELRDSGIDDVGGRDGVVVVVGIVVGLRSSKRCQPRVGRSRRHHARLGRVWVSRAPALDPTEPALGVSQRPDDLPEAPTADDSAETAA